MHRPRVSFSPDTWHLAPDTYLLHAAHSALSGATRATGPRFRRGRSVRRSPHGKHGQQLFHLGAFTFLAGHLSGRRGDDLFKGRSAITALKFKERHASLLLRI